MNQKQSLLEKMLHPTNTQEACTRVMKNKGASGVDGMEYTELREYRVEYREELEEQIRTRKYKPKPVKRKKYCKY